MSADVAYSSCCASCGVEIDDVKLVPCDGCDLAKYCSDACQELHRPEHAGKCRKRAAELRDDVLFKQLESSCFGECPICSLPLSLDKEKSVMHRCCSKLICNGCVVANMKRLAERRLQYSCPFCREPLPKTDAERDKRMKKRIEANDPIAMVQVGLGQYKNEDYQSAFEYWTKAAESDDAEAHYHLARLYHHGLGVEKDEGKMMHHWEEATIGGHPEARYELGRHEGNNGKIERAVKHWIIAATQGEDKAIKELLEAFKAGFVEKDVLAATLRAQKAAVDATKSPQRKAAEFYRMKRLLQNQNSST